MRATREALDLFLQGSHVFARMEHNGIRIDVPYLEKAIQQTGERIATMETDLRKTKFFEKWGRRFGDKTNLDSRQQLAEVLVNDYKIDLPKTEKENWRSDESALEMIDHPFARKYVRMQKFKKAKNTYLKNILNESVDGYLHADYSLHTTVSYRSSSNFQQWPVRDAEIGELIRRSFIAREGWRLLEIDFKAIEVAIAACYHKDPAMLEYIKDASKDMHRDMAMECYMVKKAQVSKEIRYCAKNKFVFPQFYGDYYVDCAKHLWEAIDRMKLKTVDDIPIKAHLFGKGIIELGDCNPNMSPRDGTFEQHIQRVERNFWEKRFPVYNQWKRDWWNQYLRDGGFLTHTGFYISGVYKRNQVINLPVQGSAFHCLLWVLIQLDKWLRKNKMKSLIVGQIHDSMLLDVVESEYDEIMAKVKQLATVDLPNHWKWIIVPMSIEAEASPVDGSWYDKESVEFAA